MTIQMITLWHMSALLSRAGRLNSHNASAKLFNRSSFATPGSITLIISTNELASADHSSANSAMEGWLKISRLMLFEKIVPPTATPTHWPAARKKVNRLTPYAWSLFGTAACTAKERDG